MRRACLLAAVVLAFPAAPPANAEEGYEPIFSEAYLDSVDPPARARLEVLEAENRARWEAAREEAALPSVDGIYRTRDAEGNVVFTDRPPHPGAEHVAVDPPEPSAASLEAYRRALADQAHVLEVRAHERRLDAAAERKRQEAEAARRERADRCAALDHEIADLKRGGAAYYELDENGERRYLTEAMLAARIEEMERTYYQGRCG